MQEADGCWEEYTWDFLSTTLTGQVCCAKSTDDCCKINPGALAGVIIGGIVVLFLIILSFVGCFLFRCCSCCPCNKHNPSKPPPRGGDARAGTTAAPGAAGPAGGGTAAVQF